MIYRKTPPQPPRLLLRVAGLGALAAAAGIAACGSSTSGGGVTGFVVQPEGDGGDASAEDSSLQNDGPNGIVGYPDAAADTMNIFCCLDGSGDASQDQ